ncbi:MAG: GIY-YIG nuclease family protein [Clostridia bacterium]|nr:GIY-YIG nuclease family protein [Clostridia bacterium]
MKYYVYIMSNWNNKVFYTGVTNDIARRVYEHKNKFVKGFTEKYNINKLLYVEEYSDIETALNREKYVKKLSHKNKEKLIDTINKERIDLYDSIL